jgi:protein SCO1/2
MKLLNVLLIVICLSAWVVTAACNQASQPTVNVPPEVKPVKHYYLKGKVVSIDKRAKMLNVDSEGIPGFMEPMTMPYKIKPESGLDQLHPGDSITADLLVQDEGAGAWLENIAVTGHSPPSQKK